MVFSRRQLSVSEVVAVVTTAFPLSPVSQEGLVVVTQTNTRLLAIRRLSVERVQPDRAIQAEGTMDTDPPLDMVVLVVVGPLKPATIRGAVSEGRQHRLLASEAMGESLRLMPHP
jgi:hypothetical protein